MNPSLSRIPLSMLSTCLLVAGLSVSHVSAAEYEPGRVPEATNAFTLHPGQTRLSLVGSTALGMSGSSELTTYLAADLALFPNLEIKSPFAQSESFQAAWMLGVGIGGLPIIAGGIFPLPLPGAAVGAAGVGIALASIQTGVFYASFRATQSLTLSMNAGCYAMEGTISGLAGGFVVSTEGGGAGVTPFSFSGSRLGFTSGLEYSETLGLHNAIVLAGDVYLNHALQQGAPDGMLVPRAYWTHALKHFHFSLGAYSMLDFYPGQWPQGTGSKQPIGEYANIFWTWG